MENLATRLQSMSLNRFWSGSTGLCVLRGQQQWQGVGRQNVERRTDRSTCCATTSDTDDLQAHVTKATVQGRAA